MSEDTGQPQPAPEHQERGVAVLLDDRDVRTLYANAYRIYVAAEEVIVDYGFTMPNPNPNPQQAGPQMILKISDRVVMSFSNVKRLTASLQQLIRRYEQQFGEISTAPPQRRE